MQNGPAAWFSHFSWPMQNHTHITTKMNSEEAFPKRGACHPTTNQSLVKHDAFHEVTACQSITTRRIAGSSFITTRHYTTPTLITTATVIEHVTTSILTTDYNLSSPSSSRFLFPVTVVEVMGRRVSGRSIGCFGISGE